MKFVVTASDWRLSRGATLSFLKKYSSAPMASVEPNSTALIACTSGATGVPKGVEFTQAMINEHIRLFTEVLGQKEGDKDVPFLPLFALYDIGLGATAVLPRFDASRPLEIDSAHAIRVLREAQVNSSFGSPTIWHKLSEYMAKSGSELPALQRIFLIGAPVQDATLKMLRKVVSQDCSVFTPYGATEALPVAVVSSDERLDMPQVASLSREQGVLVGRAVPDLELKVVAISDGPLQSIDSLPPLEIGEILVSGAQVSQRYFRNESATRLSKIDIDGKRWHRMGDVGYLDSNGFLYFCGRAVHRVVTRDRTYFSVSAERVANAHPNVRRSALVGLYGGREAALVIEPEPSKWPDSSSAEKLFELELLKLTEVAPATKGISKFFFHRSFPVDGRHNAKIFRGELGEWATKVDRKRSSTSDSTKVVNWNRR
jgi:acyl-CoA synthetase (AMP-forming)/AMP-acid ligase II